MSPGTARSKGQMKPHKHLFVSAKKGVKGLGGMKVKRLISPSSLWLRVRSVIKAKNLPALTPIRSALHAVGHSL